ncbi:MAG: response regulator transcription factor [Culicoidibacterales bacterium]
MRILIIEDDKSVREQLQQFITKYGYDTQSITDFVDVCSQIQQIQPDLLLLDVNLPGQDGYTLCREIRKTSMIPIMIVTSRAGDVDELMAMHLGADDFVTKPFNAQILIARIEALLKRTYTTQAQTIITYEQLQLDIAKGSVSTASGEVILTKNELLIFQYLLQHRGQIIAREVLMEYLWSTQSFIDDNTLSVNITRLRKKITSLGIENPIQTRRGLGYIIR